jgi:predicted phosphohydrolase
MSLYAIGDLHLSLSVDKPMDIFGGRWEKYLEKIIEGMSCLTDEDTCVLCGDTSWGTTLDEALEDFRLIDSFPGRKIILKGNHDYWWNTASKMNKFFEANDLKSLNILHNNCYFYGDIAICGTRGWFYEEAVHGGEHDKKVMNREVGRLEASLKAAGDIREKIVFLHYPPRFNDFICTEVVDVMKRYGVKRCYYGHIHGIGHKYAFTGTYSGTDYHMISSDYVKFRPVLVEK